MRITSSPFLLAVTLSRSAALALIAMAVPAAGTVPAAIPPSDFRLPPAPTATATPQVQGPVDTEGPVPISPRVIPTARPAPTPTATPRQLPTILQPLPAANPTPETRRFTPAARATSGPQTSGSNARTGEGLSGSPRDLTPAAPILDGLPSSTTLPNTADSIGNIEAPSGSSWLSSWGIWLALVAGLLAVIGAAIMMRSRRESVPAGMAPIEPPLARRRPDPQPSPASGPAASSDSENSVKQAPIAAKPTGPISLSVTPEKLSRSMMNATLSFIIAVRNHTGETVENLQISGDLVTAHGKAPIAEQLADSATVLAPLATIGAISARNTGEATANFTLPIAQIRTIAQGKATLYVPLLRLRVAADGLEPVTQTFVIGMKPPGSGKVQPFRLDEMPQTYRQIGSRVLD